MGCEARERESGKGSESGTQDSETKGKRTGIVHVCVCNPVPALGTCNSRCDCGDVSKGALVSLVLLSEGLLCKSLERLTSIGQTILLNGSDGHAQTD